MKGMRIDGFCDGCMHEQKEIRLLPFGEIFVCIHFPACVRIKDMIEMRRTDDYMEQIKAGHGIPPIKEGEE